MSSELEGMFAVYVGMLAPDLAAGMVAQHPVGPGRIVRRGEGVRRGPARAGEGVPTD